MTSKDILESLIEKMNKGEELYKLEYKHTGRDITLQIITHIPYKETFTTRYSFSKTVNEKDIDDNVYLKMLEYIWRSFVKFV